MKNPDNSIDFKPVSVEDAGKERSPAEHAAHMESLDGKFIVSQEKAKADPEDSARIEGLVKSLEVAAPAPEKQEENLEQQEEGVVETAPAEKSALEKYLGETPSGTTRFKEASIDDKQSANTKSINKSFFKTGVGSAAVGAGTSLAAWIAAASGVATSLGGVSMVTIAAVAAPVGVGVAAVAGTVWAGRRLLNRYRANKARESLY
jgi:hypothetical protein